MKKTALLFFITATFNGLLWLLITPIWHTPDEQAHFAQVAYMVEKGKIQGGKDILDLTEEIYISEKLLGTARDNLGNNKFTFHPEYRIEYSQTSIGKDELFINSLAKTDAKRKFIYAEASRYPVLYYIPATWIYRLFYENNLFERVFAVRFWSLLLYVLTIYAVYRIGKLFFLKDRLSSFTLTILVAFQPMFIFSNIGVNSDSLGNFLFTLFIYLSTKIILNVQKKDLIFLFIVTTLSVYTKPQFIVMLPLLLILYLLVNSRTQNKFNKGLITTRSLLGIGIIFFVFYLLQWPKIMLNNFLNNINISSLIQYTWEYTIPHTIKEVLPWYWGIYDWLGVTYPRLVHRIINRVIFVSLIGLMLSIVGVIRNKLWTKLNNVVILFYSIVIIIYFIAISLFDYLSWYTSKYSLGVQGRYFFPLISIQMLFLLIGIRKLLPNFFKLKIIGTKILAMAMISLNFFALYMVASTYYDTSSVKSFLVQVSQYKPWFVKNGFFEICLILNIILLILGVIYPLISLPNKRSYRHF